MRLLHFGGFYSLTIPGWFPAHPVCVSNTMISPAAETSSRTAERRTEEMETCRRTKTKYLWTVMHGFVYFCCLKCKNVFRVDFCLSVFMSLWFVITVVLHLYLRCFTVLYKHMYGCHISKQGEKICPDWLLEKKTNR